jgi:manganese/iron transport system permease protein
MLILSVAIAVAASFLGVYLSFFIDSAPAPTIVLMLSAAFIAAFVVTTLKAGRIELGEEG